jgi:hypothetical protein
MDKGNPFVGRWTYRSFHNDPELSKAFNELRFGAGTLVLDEPDYGRLSGSLGGEGWNLSLVGGYTYGNPFALRFQGSGDIGGEEMGLRLRWIFGTHMAEWSRPKSSNCRNSHTYDSAQQRPGKSWICSVIHCCKASLGLIAGRLWRLGSDEGGYRRGRRKGLPGLLSEGAFSEGRCVTRAGQP